MGLSSVFSTAITGLSAAETTIDVVGNNVANANTNGFKASEALFATQFLRTLSLGSAPTDNNGGTNPRQIGLGTKVASITPNFSQGTIQISAAANDIAIQGDGFFIVEASSGEHLYTRNGSFQLNSKNELVTSTGQRLLGFGVDENFQLQTTELKPLVIPLGSAAVAQATETAELSGTLVPDGDLATTAEIIESGVLGDSALTRPTNTTTANLSAVPGAGTTLGQSAGGGGLAAGEVYRYQVVFADGAIGSDTPTESLPSATLGPITVTGGNDQVALSNLPVDPTGRYTARRIYRTDATGTGAYHYVGEVLNNLAGQSFTDGANAAAWSAGQSLDTTTLTGNYNYYVTFADASGGPPNGVESRPSQIINPTTISGGRVQLENIPVDTSGNFTVRRIYRNLANNPNVFYYVGEIDNNLPSQTFTDNNSDATIALNPQVNLDGPAVNFNTLLTNVVQRNANDGYDSPFKEGVLEFKGSKAEREINPPKQFTITGTSTVLDLITFMEESLGIQRSTAANGIPEDISGLAPGGTLNNGRIRLVGNNGKGNAIEISTADFTLTPSTGTVSQPNLSFGSTQKAVGESATADFLVYDSLGIPLNVRLTAVLESRNATTTTYRWFADSADNDPTSGVQTAVGSGLVTFDGKGNLIPGGTATISIDRSHIASDKPLSFTLDFSNVSGLASKVSSLQVTRQDGQPPGKLTNYIIDESGRMRGVFDNGFERDLGQMRLARFANNTGLEARGQNMYAGGVNSGLPVQGNPGQEGIGQVVGGAVELSNTDIGKNLIDLILASTQYRGNARVITAAQQLLDELLNLRR
ncbi:MAG: flagellar hook-basal body complex protein [Pirellulales bacterium]|nr:flagellar hook-basal body complex protein [Pirellulales bacterium]